MHSQKSLAAYFKYLDGLKRSGLEKSAKAALAASWPQVFNVGSYALVNQVIGLWMLTYSDANPDARAAEAFEKQ